MRFYGLTLHGLAVVLALLAYVVASHAFNQRRHPTAAIAWVFFILLVPYVALPAFLVFGTRKLPRPLLLPAPEPLETASPWPVRTIAALGQPAPTAYRELVIHADGGDAARALWRVVDAARESIDLCTFIVGDDDLGRAVVARLVDKARSGVRVRVMVDGMGRLMRRHPDLSSLVDAGAAYTVFVPPLRQPLRARSNLRDHRKMVIVDAARDDRRLWCGGRNLAGEYFTGLDGAPAWHDLTFDCGGPLVLQAAALFARDWAYARGRRLPPDAADDTPRTPVAMAGPATANASTEAPIEAPIEAPTAQLIASGPDQADDTIQTVLVTGAYQAERRILLITPYFVPDSALLAALCFAARRGVAVDLLLPARSNHRMSDVGRRRALRALATAGGRVWLAPQMLHAKLAVFDDTLALSGSANLDSRSLFLNYELMVAFHDRDAIARFAAWFERERTPAIRFVAKPAGLVADVAEGLVLWTGFQL